MQLAACGRAGASAPALMCDNAALEFMPCIGTCGRTWVKGLFFCSFHCSELLHGLRRGNELRFGLGRQDLEMIEKRCKASQDDARESRAREAMMTQGVQEAWAQTADVI